MALRGAWQPAVVESQAEQRQQQPHHQQRQRRAVQADAVDLERGESYYVTVDSGAFVDAAANPFAGVSGTTAWNFSTPIADQETVLCFYPNWIQTESVPVGFDHQ